MYKIKSIIDSFDNLLSYSLGQNLAGYDPYDGLNSNIGKFSIGKGAYLPLLIFQIFNNFPFNLRPYFGIKKGYNPKGLSLFIRTFLKLHKFTKNEKYVKIATNIFSYLMSIANKEHQGISWGYNFETAHIGDLDLPMGVKPKNQPSALVTVFVGLSFIELYRVTNEPKIKTALIEITNFLTNELQISEFDEGICFSYTPLKKDAIFNVTVLVSEYLIKISKMFNKPNLVSISRDSVNFVLSRQNKDGSWFYGFDLKSESNYSQFDFHQGFVLSSLFSYKKYDDLGGINTAIQKGLSFYYDKQFDNSGKSLYRFPRKYPIDIHNQAQGIITFSELHNLNSEFLSFAHKIAMWTIDNMQDERGFFYFQNWNIFTNKIPYIRWSQAWMGFALITLIDNTVSTHETINKK